jgi:2-keto-3-deoxy-6-phosphogluconate aldolase
LQLSSTQALKVLRTSEFMPYVVFIAAPELDTLRAMHKAVVEAGITTKLLTVRSVQASGVIFLLKFFLFLLGMFNSIYSYL